MGLCCEGLYVDLLLEAQGGWSSAPLLRGGGVARGPLLRGVTRGPTVGRAGRVGGREFPGALGDRRRPTLFWDEYDSLSVRGT